MFFALSKLLWVVAAPSNLILLALLLGLGLLLAGRTRIARKVLAGAVGLLVLIILSPLGALLLGSLESRFPTVKEVDVPPAGVIVLGGWTETEISLRRDVLALNDAAERVLAALALSHKFPDAKLVFTGGDGSYSGDVGNEADDVKRLLLSLNFDEGRVVYERASRNTAENAAFTKEIIQPKPGERWLLITSAAHMPRAVGCFRAVGFPVIPLPVDYRTVGNSERWRLIRPLSEKLATLDLAVHEWLGLAFYRLSGRTDAFFPAPEAVP